MRAVNQRPNPNPPAKFWITAALSLFESGIRCPGSEIGLLLIINRNSYPPSNEPCESRCGFLTSVHAARRRPLARALMSLFRHYFTAFKFMDIKRTGKSKLKKRLRTAVMILIGLIAV